MTYSKNSRGKATISTREEYQLVEKYVKESWDAYRNCDVVWSDLSNEEKSELAFLPHGWRKYYKQSLTVLELLGAKIGRIYSDKSIIRVKYEIADEYKFACKDLIDGLYKRTRSLDLVSGTIISIHVKRLNRTEWPNAPSLNRTHFIILQNILYEQEKEVEA